MNGEFSGPVWNPFATLIYYLHSRAATRRQRTSLEVMGSSFHGRNRPSRALQSWGDQSLLLRLELSLDRQPLASPPDRLVQRLLQKSRLRESSRQMISLNCVQLNSLRGAETIASSGKTSAKRIMWRRLFSVCPRPYPAVNCADRADTMLSVRFVQVLKSVPGRTSPSLADRKRARPFRRHSRPTDRAPCAVRCRESPPCPGDARPRKASRTSAAVH